MEQSVLHKYLSFRDIHLTLQHNGGIRSEATEGIAAQAAEGENGARTRDLNLGKVALYQLSYFRIGTANIR